MATQCENLTPWGFDFSKGIPQVDARTQEILTKVGVHPDDYKTTLSGNPNPFVGSNPDESSLAPYPPQMFLTPARKAMLQSGNWSEIKQWKASIDNYLRPVYNKIQSLGKDAFLEQQIPGNNQSLKVCQLNNAAVWIWTTELPASHLARQGLDPAKTAYHVQCGTYTTGESFMGISSYIWSNIPLTFVSTVISGIFAIYLQSAITAGLTWATSAAVAHLTLIAIRLGFQVAIRLVSTILSAAGFVVGAILSVLLFFAMQWLLSFIFKTYTLVMDVYNFDPKYIWSNSDLDRHFGNISIPNDEFKSLKAPPMTSAGDVVTPPGWQPMPTLDTVVGYMTFIFQNNNIVLEGLGVALQFWRYEVGDIQEPSTPVGALQFKYRLPRFNDNQIGIQQGSGNLTTFYNGPFAPDMETSITAYGMKISAKTDYLNGAPDDTYRYRVNIGEDQ